MDARAVRPPARPRSAGAPGTGPEPPDSAVRPQRRVRSAMKGFVFHGPGQASWQDVPDPAVTEPTDAVVQVDAVTICGTDLHILRATCRRCRPYRARPRGGRRDRRRRRRGPRRTAGRPGAGLLHHLLRPVPVLPGRLLRPVPRRGRLDPRPPRRRHAGRVRPRPARRPVRPPAPRAPCAARTPSCSRTSSPPPTRWAS